MLLRGRVSYLFISVIDRLSAVITSLYLAKVYLKLTLLTQDQIIFMSARLVEKWEHSFDIVSTSRLSASLAQVCMVRIVLTPGHATKSSPSHHINHKPPTIPIPE